MNAYELPTKATRKQARQADAAARAQRAWSARVAGGTWAQVAELVGFSDAPTAVRAVRNYFGQLPKLEADETRQLWRDRLEHLWKQAVRDVAEQRPGALRAGVSIAQRAAQLDGLDAPTRLQVSDPGPVELQAFIDRLVELERGERGPSEGDIFELEELDDGTFGSPAVE